MFKQLFLSIILIAVASPVLAVPSTKRYLNYPSSDGVNTLWATSSGASSVQVNNSSSSAAIFNKSVSIYSLTGNNAYFDISSSSFISHIYIGSSSSDTIDLNGNIFTVNANSEQSINFFAALTNSKVSTLSGGLSVSGGGSITFDNIHEKYSSGMGIGTVSISKSTISIPTGVYFGLQNNNGNSYSSLSFQNAKLFLDNNTGIGSNDDNISVPITINDSNSIIKLSSNVVTSSITPYFLASSGQILNIDTNGCILNIHGNNANGIVGNGFKLNINDNVANGTLNLYGGQTSSAGGNDYSGTDLTIVSGNVNLLLDNTQINSYASQSIGNISMTGGSLTGGYYANDVTISGNSFFSGAGNVNSITMSGNSVISPSVTSANTYGITSFNDITANVDTPHYYVNLTADGQYSQIQINGNLNIPRLSVNLLLGAGTYPSNAPVLFPIINVNGGGTLGIPTINPTWNLMGVTLDSGDSATGSELQLSLSEDGSNLNLEIQFLSNLHVATTQTTAGSSTTPTPDPTPTPTPTPVPALSFKTQVEEILQSIKSLPSDQATNLGNALFASTERTSILNNLGTAGSASVAASTTQAVSSIPSTNNTTSTVHDIAALALEYQNDVQMPTSVSHLFSASQHKSFNHLSKQLQFLKFQSINSADYHSNIAPTYNNLAPVANPFDKFVYLSNGTNHIWMQPFSGIQSLDSYDQVTGMTLKNSGTAFGGGYRILPNATLGALMSISFNSYTLDQNNGNGTINSYDAGFYGDYSPSEGFKLKGSTLIGEDHYTAQRNITTLSLSAKNTHRGWHISGNIEASYKFKYGVSSLSPYIGFTPSKTYQNAYQETNAGAFNLNVPSSSTKNLSTEIGTRFQHSFMSNGILLQPLVSISMLREQAIQTQNNTTLSFSDSSDNFSVATSNQTKTYAKASIGCVGLLENNITISSFFTGKVKKHERSVELFLKTSYNF